MMWLLFICMLGVALLDMTSIGLVLPLFHVIFSEDSSSLGGEYLQRLLPEGLPQEELIFWVAGVFPAVFVLKNIALLAMVHGVNRGIKGAQGTFLSRMFDIYVSRPLIFHLKRNSAEILRNLISSVPAAFEAVRLMMLIALESLLVLAACTLLLFFEPVVTIVTAVVLLGFGIAFHRLMGPVFQRWGQRTHLLEGASIKWINHAVGAIRDVKLLDREGYMSEVFHDISRKRVRYQSRMITAQHIPRVLIESVVMTGFLIVLLVLVATKESFEEVIFILGLFGVASLRLMPSVNRILISTTDLKQRVASIDVLYEDLREAHLDAPESSVSTEVPSLRFDREIKLDAIRFSYPAAEKGALHGVDLVIARGESVGFIGPSGAGKTTLIDIILGLLRPTEGRLLVDGSDVFSNLRGWQDHLGYVPQSVFLLDDTLRRNIAFGRHDEDIDDDRIADVVRMASLDSVVGELPNGLETVIGESGARLSGGQRQRVAIARALYHNPDVLVFDEATAALDNETERDVTRAIETLAGDKTVLIIAHRLSTVRNCDRLVVMNAGRVVAVGSFDELLADNAEFRRMVQLGSFETEAA